MAEKNKKQTPVSPVSPARSFTGWVAIPPLAAELPDNQLTHRIRAPRMAEKNLKQPPVRSVRSEIPASIDRAELNPRPNLCVFKPHNIFCISCHCRRGRGHFVRSFCPPSPAWACPEPPVLPVESQHIPFPP